MLKQRVITAIIMVSVIATGIIYLPERALAILFAALVLVAAWEWAGMSGLLSVFGKSLFTLSTAALLYWFSEYTSLFDVIVNFDKLQDIIGLGCLWWAIALLWVKSYPASALIWKSIPMRILMGYLTLVPAWLALVYLRLHSDGIALIFLLIAMVVAADTGAYFSGRAWGKAKLAAAVSPGKSWVGFWGGLASSCLLVVLLWFFVGASQPILAVIAVAVVTSLASVLGDLLESMVKRQQGIKDSGVILPGHGGMMDRLDSITAAAPVFALSLMLTGW